jgi:acetylornithine deacetylase
VTEPSGTLAVEPADARSVIEAVDARREAIVELLRGLVRIPSETHPPGGDELEAQREVARVFVGMGLEVECFEPSAVEGIEDHPGWWPGLDYENRPNVVGVRRGTGGGRSLILNGHIDVVPAGPREAWSVDPYAAELRDGKVYGRGSVDMKAGIAAMTMALACVADAGFDPAGDVILESVVNEELGGFNGTLACCVRGYEADAAIVTEPTGGNVVAATMGGQAYRATVRGEAVHHGWWWKGVSALDKALVVKEALDGWELLRAEEPIANPLFADRSRFPRPAKSDTVWYLSAGEPDVMATPSAAVLDFWVDVLPGDDREELLRRFEAHVLEATARDDHLRRHPPALERTRMRPFEGAEIDVDHPVLAVLAGAHRAATGTAAELVAGGAANDSMIFNLFSPTPATVYGPGTTTTAHGPDEHVAIDDLIEATKTLALTIMGFCGYRPRDARE